MTIPGRPRALSFAKITILVSLAIIPASLFVPEPGAAQVALILCWTGFCIAAVLADRMLIWALLNLGPLAVISVSYWLALGMSEDPFGERYALPEALLVASFITGGTGVFSIVRTATRAKGWQPRV
ncbi:MAG TPA: hypothetical protein VH331_03840 [Allosphingosinicella sp.]|jgi:hypothetical protein|nr:hypothetical protein [Allosphingosinicella sp.]